MRISDWSSDVCSSDLAVGRLQDDPNVGIVEKFETGGKRDRGAVAGIAALGRESRNRHALLLAGESAVGRRINIGPDVLIRTQCYCEPLLLRLRSEEHTYELQSLMRISYAFFSCN